MGKKQTRTRTPASRPKRKPAAHPGQPHRWSSEEASQAGHLGGLAKARNDLARLAKESGWADQDVGGEDSLDPEQDDQEDEANG